MMPPLLLCGVLLKLLQCFGITASACGQSVVVRRLVPFVLYAVLLRVPQCSGIKPSACCLLLLLGDAPGKAELRYHVKVRDVSSTVVKLQLSAPFAVARTQSVCCQQELTQGLEPQASVDMTC